MVARNDSEMEVTEEEFKEIVGNGHKLVVVDFYAEWCMPCLMLAPIIDDLAEEIKEVKFVDENQALASKFSVSSIPCLIIFKEGNEVDRLIGAQDGEVIEGKVREYL
jgi:thioredoxin 1